MFSFGQPNTKKMVAKRDVNGLIKALAYQKSTIVRKNAAYALGEIGDVRAAESLITALTDEDHEVRECSVDALGKLGDVRAVEPLIAALQDSRYRNNRVACALGRLRDQRAVEPLIAVLKTGSRLDSRDVSEALVKHGSSAVGPLIAMLKGRKHGVAAETLVKLGTLAVDPLIAVLNDGDARVTISAARILGEIGDSRAAEPLKRALTDSNADVRKNAAEALNKLNWKPGKDELGIWYYVELRQWDECSKYGVNAVKPLLDALQNSDKLSCRAIAKGLGEIGDPRAVEPLISLLTDPDVETRAVAANALNKIGWQPGNDQNGAYYWIAMQQWGKCMDLGAQAIEPLVIMLKDQNKSVRQAAAEALGKLGDVRAVKPLINALDDKVKIVSITAENALTRIGAPAIEGLTEVIRSGSADEKIKIAAVLDKLGWLPGQDENGLWYWWATRNWKEVKAVDGAVLTAFVSPLIAFMKAKNHTKEDWNAAVEMLEVIYRSGKLGDASKKRILRQSSIVSQQHIDQVSYSCVDKVQTESRTDEIWINFNRR